MITYRYKNNITKLYSYKYTNNYTIICICIHVSIPLATTKMKWISMVIAMSLNITTILRYFFKKLEDKYIYISMYTKYNYMYMC